MDVLATVAAKKLELDSLRANAGTSIAILAAWYDVELTYTANAIEGNILTRLETAEALERGLTIGGKPLKDHLEVIGHKDALEFVRDLAQRPEAVRESNIRAIHHLIIGRVNPREAGKYSHHERMIKGSPVVLPPAWELKPLMSDFAAWLATAEAGPETALEAHARLVTIHPFSDGNGRIARLLMNLLLLKALLTHSAQWLQVALKRFHK